MTTLDDIAWILNMRGSDISFNPVFFSHLLFNVENKKVRLFLDACKIDEEVQAYINEHQIEVHPYEAISEHLAKLVADGKKVGFDTGKANSALHKIVKDSMVEVSDVIASMKCLKNPVEAEGMRQANIRDCAALMKYFAFLEEELKKENHGLTEYTGAEILAKRYRAASNMFR